MYMVRDVDLFLGGGTPENRNDIGALNHLTNSKGLCSPSSGHRTLLKATDLCLYVYNGLIYIIFGCHDGIYMRPFAP